MNPPPTPKNPAQTKKDVVSVIIPQYSICKFLDLLLPSVMLFSIPSFGIDVLTFIYCQHNERRCSNMCHFLL